MASVASVEAERTAAIASVASATDAAPVVATSRADSAARAVSAADSAELRVASAISSVRRRAPSTVWTCFSAPAATSPMAWAISPTARPASDEVDAICSEADDSTTALSPTRPIMPARESSDAL